MRNKQGLAALLITRTLIHVNGQNQVQGDSSARLMHPFPIPSIMSVLEHVFEMQMEIML